MSSFIIYTKFHRCFHRGNRSKISYLWLLVKRVKQISHTGTNIQEKYLLFNKDINKDSMAYFHQHHQYWLTCQKYLNFIGDWSGEMLRIWVKLPKKEIYET